MNLEESESDDEVKEPEEKKKVALNECLKERFEKLKEQRLKYARKAAKKEQMRLSKGKKKLPTADLPMKPTAQSHAEDEVMKKHVLNYDTRAKKLDWRQLDDDPGLEKEKNDLENGLNAAIKSQNLELAEKMNEQLIDYDSKLHINYAVNAYRYETEKLTDPTRMPKKRLKWQFEAKERWESKANM